MTTAEQLKIENEYLDAVARSNEQRERQKSLPANESGSDDTSAAIELARLTRRVEDLEYAMRRAVNWINIGFSQEARRDLLREVGGM